MSRGLALTVSAPPCTHASSCQLEEARVLALLLSILLTLGLPRSLCLPSARAELELEQTRAERRSPSQLLFLLRPSSSLCWRCSHRRRRPPRRRPAEPHLPSSVRPNMRKKTSALCLCEEEDGFVPMTSGPHLKRAIPHQIYRFSFIL
jgi:hypothetical protein